MPRFGRKSTERLKETDYILQYILKKAIKVYDFTIIKGYRGKKEQTDAYNKGLSGLPFPKSKHNIKPSLAVDIAPYPVDWKDEKRFYYLAGLIKGIAHTYGIGIRWGGDWDGDGSFEDQKFKDLPHFELIF